MILKYFILLQIFTKCFSIACDSLANSCPVIVGVPLNNGEIFEISPSQRLFFNLAVSLKTFGIFEIGSTNNVFVCVG